VRHGVLYALLASDASPTETIANVAGLRVSNVFGLALPAIESWSTLFKSLREAGLEWRRRQLKPWIPTIMIDGIECLYDESLKAFADAAKMITEQKLMNVIAISSGRAPRALADLNTASRAKKHEIFDVPLADAGSYLLNAGFAPEEAHVLRDALGGRLCDLNLARIVESHNRLASIDQIIKEVITDYILPLFLIAEIPISFGRTRQDRDANPQVAHIWEWLLRLADGGEKNTYCVLETSLTLPNGGSASAKSEISRLVTLNILTRHYSEGDICLHSFRIRFFILQMAGLAESEKREKFKVWLKEMNMKSSA
jgi:hypothetical protein